MSYMCVAVAANSMDLWQECLFTKVALPIYIWIKHKYEYGIHYSVQTVNRVNQYNFK